MKSRRMELATIAMICIIAGVAVGYHFTHGAQERIENIENISQPISYPDLSATAKKINDEIWIDVFTESIPRGEWQYSIRLGYESDNWIDGNVELKAPSVKLVACKAGSYFVSLKHKSSGHIYFAGQMVIISQGTPCTVKCSGVVVDKDNGVTDNYKNGKLAIDITVKSDDIDDVFYPTCPLKIGIDTFAGAWGTGDLDLSASGKTVANFGENIQMDGVLAMPAMTGRLYVKITVPTTTSGAVDNGMTIKVEAWPTNDAVSAMDGMISPAVHDTITTENWWNYDDCMEIYLTGIADYISMTGWSVFLHITEIDQI